MTEDKLKRIHDNINTTRPNVFERVNYDGINTYSLADIARQFTIANEIATRRHQIEYALAFQKDGKINYAVDPPLDLSTSPTPDDVPAGALVEAVKKFVGEIETAVDEDMIVCDYNILASSVGTLKSALAAHKKGA